MKTNSVSVNCGSHNRDIVDEIWDDYSEIVENLDDFELHSQDVERHVCGGFKSFEDVFYEC